MSNSLVLPSMPRRTASVVFPLEELSGTDLIVTGFGVARRTFFGAQTDLRPILPPALQDKSRRSSPH
jgi:hypothetical protein